MHNLSGGVINTLNKGERGRFSYHLGFGLTQAGVVTQAGICLPKLREGVMQKASPDPSPCQSKQRFNAGKLAVSKRAYDD